MNRTNRNWIFCALLAGLVLPTICGAAGKSFDNAERFEFFDEALRLFTCVPAGGDITAGKEARAAFAYGRTKVPGLFVRDYTDKAANDFSVRFDAPGTDEARVIGFTPGPWIDSWAVGSDGVLHLQMKATVECGPVKLALLDANKKKAVLGLSGFKPDSTWQALALPMKEFKQEEGFDFAAGIVGCEVQAALPQGAKVWFDDIHFTTAAGVLGVTEKPLDQRIDEARRTLAARQQSARTDPFSLNAALIAKGEQLEQANEFLTGYFQSEETRKAFRPSFHLRTGDFVELALNYGSRGRIAAGRLSPKAEKALLEIVWPLVKDYDDIANARNSTWWLLGSENHDIIHKVNCLLTAQLLSHSPAFADKIYQDAGKGSGYDIAEFEGAGRWADGKSHTPVDHYQAWVKFFREFLRERARKGLFVEVRSNHYISAQIGYVSLLHTYCADAEVRKLAGMLLDLIWADFVQDSIAGINGGAKTRSSVRTRMSDMLIPLLGGPGASDLTYELPPLLWKMALKREPLGEYAYLSRRPGEEEDVWPRPAGCEMAMMCDREARFLRYSWVTPDYVLGTQMDHPAAVHNHLSIVSRWSGVTFSASTSVPSSNHSGVYPYLVSKPEYDAARKKKMAGQRYWDFMYHSVQYRNVLILQQPKPARVRYVSPKWYPSDHTYALGLDAGVYIEDADEVAEQKGWAFVRKGNAYVAIRPILLDQGVTGPRGVEPRGRQLREDSYTWSADRKIMLLKDPYSTIIMETGRKAVNGGFAEFRKAVLANPLEVRNLIAGAFDVIYRGSGPEAKELVFNHDSNALPTIGGESVNFSYPNVFESPFLNSKYNSGVVTIGRGDEAITLDFNKAERRAGAAGGR